MTDQSNGDDRVVEFFPSPLPAETAVQPDGSYEARVTTRGTLRVFVHVGLPNDQEEEKMRRPRAGLRRISAQARDQLLHSDLTLERGCW